MLAAELEEQALLAASAEERADAAEAEAAHLRAQLEDAQVGVRPCSRGLLQD